VGRKYSHLSKERKKEIAEWIVAHPNLTIKQIAVDLSLNYMMVYRIVEEYIDIRKTYTLKNGV